MSWLTNEILFYGGMLVAVGSLIIIFLYFCVSHVKKLHLDIRLHTEYGEKDG